MSLAEPRRERYSTAHCFGGLSNRIGHDPFDGDAEASVAGERGLQMGDGAACFLIGKHACIPAGERTSHFSTVTGDMPVTLVGVCPSNIILTLRSWPSGVSLAFLCMFI